MRGWTGLLALALLAGAGSARASITYHVDQPVGTVGSVVGTIETDGTLGTLTADDILGWNLLATGDGNAVQLTSGASSVFVNGSALSATAQALSFDYAAATGSYLLFQVTPFTGRQYWCNSAGEGDCLAGVSVVPDFYTDASAQFSMPEGSHVIATAAVPEPASWAMMIGGFGLVGGAMRRWGRAAPRLA